jgi:hypothetical protein
VLLLEQQVPELERQELKQEQKERLLEQEPLQQLQVPLPLPLPLPMMSVLLDWHVAMLDARAS